MESSDPPNVTLGRPPATKHQGETLPSNVRTDSRLSTAGDGIKALLTPKEAARFLNMSVSWLAKSRMRGDGPPFIKIGRSIRYSKEGLIQWLKSQQRLSTCEQ